MSVVLLLAISTEVSNPTLCVQYMGLVGQMCPHPCLQLCDRNSFNKLSRLTCLRWTTLEASSVDFNYP